MDYGLYIITDDDLTPGSSHVRIAQDALIGGARIIQLRDKKRSGAELYAIAKEIRNLCNMYNAGFIVNDRVDIALLSGADGVHLGQDDLPLTVVRPLFPPPFIIGISVGSVDEAVLAEEGGADYLGVGPIFSTETKKDAGSAVGTEMIRKIRENVAIPIVAIGGIKLSNTREVIAAGADGIAVISAVICSPDISVAAKKFADLINR
ncbi:MAG: thiamine phosphate synthase [Methanomicrobiales archaeon]|nr:thiamine phosphate synthase [Methanomicrobiales archaeon]